MSETDEVLMLAVRDGDIAKLGTLFDRHHRILLDYLLRMTRSRTAAEDLEPEEVRNDLPNDLIDTWTKLAAMPTTAPRPEMRRRFECTVAAVYDCL